MTPSSELPAAWTKITGALQTIMSPEVYGLWFPKFSLLEDSGKTLTLVCDDPMAALWVENSYTPELKQAAMLALGGERNVKFVCADEVLPNRKRTRRHRNPPHAKKPPSRTNPRPVPPKRHAPREPGPH